MDPGLLSLLGSVIGVDDLAFDQSRSVAQFIDANIDMGCRLLEARRSAGELDTLRVPAGCESLVIEMRPDLVQRPAHDIRSVEQLALIFSPTGGIPTVLPLRADFPLAPHTNETPPGIPLTLCLYRASWSDVRLNWTPGTFIQRIRWWLETTAEGGLYGGDNPIEPLFFSSSSDMVVARELHASFFNGAYADEPLQAKPLDDGELLILLETVSNPDPHFKSRPPLSFCFIHATTPVIADGRVRVAPQNLARLNETLTSVGFDLVADIRPKISALMADKQNEAKQFGLLIAAQIASDTGSPPRQQLVAFLSAQTVADTAVALGEYAAEGDTVGKLLPASCDYSKTGEAIILKPVNVGLDVDQDSVATLSGFSGDGRKVTLVGAGTIGSALFDCLVRQGFGVWTIIDPDIVKPHNLARHTLTRSALGRSKAHVLANVARGIVGKRPEAIDADVLFPGEKGEQVERGLVHADLIIDATASPAAARHLATHPSTARRISTFFLGDARAAAVLVEGADRSVRIDDMECILVARALSDDRVTAILKNAPTEMATPASCRAPTSRVPWNRAVAFSGLVAETIRDRTSVAGPALVVHAWDEEKASIETFEIEVPQFTQLAAGDWAIRVSASLLDDLRILREKHLPSETGGAVFGAVDSWSRTIHVVAHYSNLADSVGDPSSFQRGMSGIGAHVRNVARRTRGAIVYLGEWHSHPPNHSADPSGTDLIQVAGIATLVRSDDRPGLSIIVSENDVQAVVGQLIGGSASAR